MMVNSGERTIDFSQNPLGELDDKILTHLRDALDNNGHYCKLVFNNNHLSDDAVGILAAILKGHTPIEYLCLSSCSLRDVDVMHIANAVCVKKVLKCLDLSKNPNITSAAAMDLARIIQTIPPLRIVLLTGTSIRQENCSKILDALERSFSMQVLDLPYTVGFRVLDKVRDIIGRKNNEGLGTSQKDKKMVEPKSILKKQTRTGMFETLPIPSSVATSLPKLTPPSIGESQKEHREQEQGLITQPYNPADSLRKMDFRCWADPAVKDAALHLHVLDKRCQLLKMYQKERRKQFCARRGLDENNWTASGRAKYNIFDCYPKP